jgi:hypothetical protein
MSDVGCNLTYGQLRKVNINSISDLLYQGVLVHKLCHALQAIISNFYQPHPTFNIQHPTLLCHLLQEFQHFFPLP